MRRDASVREFPRGIVGSRQANQRMPRRDCGIGDRAADVACRTSQEDLELHNKIGLYSETFLDHFKNPRNVGELEAPAVTVEIENPVCGDILRLSARFENGRVAEVKYKVRGCTAAIASGSALTEWMLGKSRPELERLKAENIDEAVGGLIPESKHAAVLCVDGVRKLLIESAS